LCIFNATPVPRPGYMFGAPEAGTYRKVIDGDALEFGGSGYSQQSEVPAHAEGFRDFPARIQLDVPPLSLMVWEKTS